MLPGHLRREHRLLQPSGMDVARHEVESGFEAAGSLTAITSPTHFAGLV